MGDLRNRVCKFANSVAVRIVGTIENQNTVAKVPSIYIEALDGCFPLPYILMIMRIDGVCITNKSPVRNHGRDAQRSGTGDRMMKPRSNSNREMQTGGFHMKHRV